MTTPATKAGILAEAIEDLIVTLAAPNATDEQKDASRANLNEACKGYLTPVLRLVDGGRQEQNAANAKALHSGDAA